MRDPKFHIPFEVYFSCSHGCTREVQDAKCALHGVPCPHASRVFALDNRNDWFCFDCGFKSFDPTPSANTREVNRLGTHLSHCNFGDNKCVCKYGDPNCPALTNEWNWIGFTLSDGERRVEELDRAHADLRKGAEQFHALEAEFYALEDKYLKACQLLYNQGGFPALKELLQYSPPNKHEADDREEDDERGPEKGCGGKCSHGVNL